MTQIGSLVIDAYAETHWMKDGTGSYNNVFLVLEEGVDHPQLIQVVKKEPSVSGGCVNVKMEPL
jgi:hypothetical protein